MASSLFGLSTRVRLTTVGITNATGVSVCGWVKFATETAWQTVFELYQSTTLVACVELNDAPRLWVSDPNQTNWSATISPDFDFSSNSYPWVYLFLTVVGDVVTLRMSTDYETWTHSATQNPTVSGTWNISEINFGYNHIYGEVLRPAQIHHMRAFDQVLSEAQAITEMKSSVAVLTPWAAWEFEDGSVADSSGNGRDLSTFSGFDLPTAGSESAPTTTTGAVTDNAIFMGMNF